MPVFALSHEEERSNVNKANSRYNGFMIEADYEGEDTKEDKMASNMSSNPSGVRDTMHTFR